MSSKNLSGDFDIRTYRSPHYVEPNFNLLDCKLLGEGHNGIVYRLPDGNIIKICYYPKSFYGEYNILLKVNGNKYFPKLFEVGSNYMIREYVPGITLGKYIKHNGLSRDLVHKVVDLLTEFKRLKFHKIDIRCKDIYVQPDGSLKVIDPKKCYSKDRNFPRHLSKGLYKLDYLDYFLEIVKEDYPRYYRVWNPAIQQYLIERSSTEESTGQFTIDS